MSSRGDHLSLLLYKKTTFSFLFVSFSVIPFLVVRLFSHDTFPLTFVVPFVLCFVVVFVYLRWW